MSTPIDLKEIERRAYLSYHQDGLIDLVIGLVILAFGIDMLNDSSVFLLLTWLPAALYVPVKRALTVPRIGLVEFARTKQLARKSLLVGLFTLSLMFGLVAFMLLSSGQPGALETFLRQYFIVLFAAVWALVIAAIGAILGLRRLFAYAAVLFLTVALGELLGIGPGWSMTTAGGLVSLAGAVVLLRFLGKYPNREVDAHEA